jgi:hypothetical protein
MHSRHSTHSCPSSGQKYQSTLQLCTPTRSPSSPTHSSCFSESIYENNDLSPKVRELAALLASKVFYYLAEYDEALSFALGAGSAFRNEANNALSAEYIETIICMPCFCCTPLV